MSVEPHKSKPGIWIIRYYPEGKKGGVKRRYVKGTKDQALGFEAEIRRNLNKGISRSSAPSIAEVIPDFMAAYKLDHQPSGVDRTLRSLQIISRFFGKYQFVSVGPLLIEEFKRERLQMVKHTTINKELAAFVRTLPVGA